MKVEIILNPGHGRAVNVSGIGTLELGAEAKTVDLPEHVVDELSRGSMFTVAAVAPRPKPKKKAKPKAKPKAKAEPEKE